MTADWRAPVREEVYPKSQDGALDDFDYNETLRFIEGLTAVDASLEADLLDAEVDAVLGRRPSLRGMKAPTERGLRLKPDDREDDESADFGWYRYLIDHAPPIDETRTAAAARQVEAGLLARERLDGERPWINRRPGEFGAPTFSLNGTLRDLVEEGEDAWDFLVLSNLRLVFHWSKGVARSIDPDWAQDAFQVGVIGLMRGLRGWDYSLGYKLSTFVSWHIRQAIQRWRANDVVMIRLPVHVWEKLNTAPETLSPELIGQVKRSQDLASLEAMLERGDDESWDGGFGAVEHAIDVERGLSKLFGLVSEQQEDILCRRYGLGPENSEPMTLDEIGRVYGVTRERIRQIEGKALQKLRVSRELRSMRAITQ